VKPLGPLGLQPDLTLQSLRELFRTVAQESLFRRFEKVGVLLENGVKGFPFICPRGRQKRCQSARSPIVMSNEW
jgi:hypothetical protein